MTALHKKVLEGVFCSEASKSANPRLASRLESICDCYCRTGCRCRKDRCFASNCSPRHPLADQAVWTDFTATQLWERTFALYSLNVSEGRQRRQQKNPLISHLENLHIHRTLALARRPGSTRARSFSECAGRSFTALMLSTTPGAYGFQPWQAVKSRVPRSRMRV